MLKERYKFLDWIRLFIGMCLKDCFATTDIYLFKHSTHQLSQTFHTNSVKPSIPTQSSLSHKSFMHTTSCIPLLSYTTSHPCHLPQGHTCPANSYCQSRVCSGNSTCSAAYCTGASSTPHRHFLTPCLFFHAFISVFFFMQVFPGIQPMKTLYTTPTECPSTQACTNQCSYGRQVDSRGCPVCQCKNSQCVDLCKGGWWLFMVVVSGGERW